MYRPIVILTVATVALAAPLAAQGHSGKQTRTWIDSRGRECRETTHVKGNGDEQYQVKCKKQKGRKEWQRVDRDDDDRDDDDRGGASNARHDRDGEYDRNGGYGSTGGYGAPTQCLDTRQRCGTVGTGYPTTLPDMASALIWGRGQRTSSATRWLGGNDYRVRYIDRDRDGRPEVASWFGGDGRMIQQWVDTNRDGRADAVKIFRDGQLVRQLGG